MICPVCHVSYDVPGDCPSCRALPQLAREQLKDLIPGGFSIETRRSCPQCGREVSGRLICPSAESVELLGFEEYFLPDEHVCSALSPQLA